MYQNIMVPMDGSELSECVLPQLEAIAQGCKVTTVVFVRVIEPLPRPSGEVNVIISDDDWESMETEKKASAAAYLDKLISGISIPGASLRGKILQGRVAETLAEYAEKNGVDLIIMATHGRSGVSRWALGSVADKVMRSSCVPVLMVRAPGCVPGL